MILCAQVKNHNYSVGSLFAIIWQNSFQVIVSLRTPKGRGNLIVGSCIY